MLTQIQRRDWDFLPSEIWDKTIQLVDIQPLIFQRVTKLLKLDAQLQASIWLESNLTGSCSTAIQKHCQRPQEKSSVRKFKMTGGKKVAEGSRILWRWKTTWMLQDTILTSTAWIKRKDSLKTKNHRSLFRIFSIYIALRRLSANWVG